MLTFDPFSAIFQAGGLVVVLVEVTRRSYLASLVPVIINAVLNEHQVVIDIVAFVAKGDFPRSRLGEKQRGKILASWVTRKMDTMAQFAIRGDTDETGSQITEVPEARSGKGSVRGGSSLRNVETVTAQPTSAAQVANSIPTGISEMPAREAYESSIVESPPLPQRSPDRDNTPTIHNPGDVQKPTTEYFPPASSNLEARTYASYVEPDTPFLQDGFYGASSAGHINTDLTPVPQPSSSSYDPQSALTDASTFDFRSVTPTPPAAHYASKPSFSMTEGMYEPDAAPPQTQQQQQQQQQHGDLWSLPSQQRHVSGGAPRPPTAESTQEEWPQEAIRHMNLGNDNGNHVTTHQGSGYHSVYYGSAM